MLPAFSAFNPAKSPDYTEGTWTPTFSGSGTAGTFTYSAQSAAYTRIGRMVHIGGYVAITAISVNPTGDMRIAGLPLTPASSCYAVIDFNAGSLDLDAGYTYSAGQITAGLAFIYITECGDNAARAYLQGSTFDNNAAASIVFSGWYFV